MHAKEAHGLGAPNTGLQLLDAWQGANIFSERERAALALVEPLTDIAAARFLLSV